MSFAAAVKSFGRLASRHTQATYGGTPAEGNADANGKNLQVGTDGTGTKFRAGFMRMANRRDIQLAGFIVDCHAAITVPDTLGLTFALGAALTKIPEAETFYVCEVGKRSATCVETRYALRREEVGTA